MNKTQEEIFDEYGLDPENDLLIGADLQSEWEGQSSLYFRYQMAAADAERAMKKQHEVLKSTRSDLILACNQDPKKCLGATKPTAANVEAWYREQFEYKKAKNVLVDCEHILDTLRAAAQSVFMKKCALENVVKMKMMGYHSEPQERDRAAVEKAADKNADVRIRRATTRKRK